MSSQLRDQPEPRLCRVGIGAGTDFGLSAGTAAAPCPRVGRADCCGRDAWARRTRSSVLKGRSLVRVRLCPPYKACVHSPLRTVVASRRYKVMLKQLVKIVLAVLVVAVATTSA